MRLRAPVNQSTLGEATSSMRIGYLVPEFPGQTHTFYWREIEGLKHSGIECQLFSTRRPPQQLMTQSWASEALSRTIYLGDMNAGEVLRSFAYAVTRPAQLGRCLQLVLGKSDLSIRGRLNLVKLVLPAAKLARLLIGAGLSYIHVQSCGDAANVAMLAHALGGIEYSLSLVGPTLEGYGPNQRNKWRHASFATVMSKLLRDVVHTRLAGDTPPIVEVLPVGVDLKSIKRSSPYTPWDGVGPCRIYSCGRLNRVKGHKDLIEAVQILREQGFQVSLSIAGEDELGGAGYHGELQAKIDEMGLGDDVSLLGAVDEEQHRHLLETSHIFALASLNEGISVAIMEAMAMCVPVVVTRVGGNNELIENNVDGVFVRPEAPEELAKAVAAVLRNPTFALALSASSRESVVASFDSEIHARKLARLLRTHAAPNTNT